MGKIRKNLTSIIVFFINLVLVGIGFLFIKNSEKAKNNNFADENTSEEALAENEVTAENSATVPASEKPTNIISEKVVPDTKNIPSPTAPAVTKPGITTNNVVSAPSTKKSSAKTKTS